MHVSSICLGPLATNCYLIRLDGASVLVDPAEDSPRLVSFLAGRAIDAVVLTHGHFDHVGGAWACRATEVLMHEADLPYVDQFFPGHPPIDRFLAEGDEVAPGLTVLHTPGHSPGSIVLVADGALFAGDLLFAGSVGRTDLPGGSARAMEASLQRIASRRGDPAVYPGHGEATTLERERVTNPYLAGFRGLDRGRR